MLPDRGYDCSRMSTECGGRPGYSFQPDAELEAQADAVAKRNSFASLAEFDEVSMNIWMIMMRAVKSVALGKQ